MKPCQCLGDCGAAARAIDWVQMFTNMPNFRKRFQENFFNFQEMEIHWNVFILTIPRGIPGLQVSLCVLLESNTSLAPTASAGDEQAPIIS